MGGGVAYRAGNGKDQVIAAEGILSPFGAEAAALNHLLGTAPPDTPLTVLMDALALIQTLQNCSDPHPKFDPTTHTHKLILCSITTHLYGRTAPTTFVKVKSHTGCHYNDNADTLTSDCTLLQPTTEPTEDN